MGALDGRVALVTGAGRGLGREHALLFAREGAAVVVNDLGGDTGGGGADATPAQQVVDEITSAGGRAVVNGDDVADVDGAQRMVDQAVDAFGRLDVLVNNAGILRDRMLVNMSVDEWDVVVRVHLRGHFLPLAAAARHWRERSKAGEALAAAVVNTTSTSGLFSNVGQANYGAAKSGIATLTEIAQKELGRYGVRVNAIAPAARTRLTLQTPGVGERMAERAAAAEFDRDDPANVSPFVAYLSTERCPIRGKTFFVYGNRVHLLRPWSFDDVIETTGRWEVAELAEAADRWGAVEWDQGLPMD